MRFIFGSQKFILHGDTWICPLLAECIYIFSLLTFQHVAKCIPVHLSYFSFSLSLSIYIRHIWIISIYYIYLSCNFFSLNMSLSSFYTSTYRLKSLFLTSTSCSIDVQIPPQCNLLTHPLWMCTWVPTFPHPRAAIMASPTFTHCCQAHWSQQSSGSCGECPLCSDLPYVTCPFRSM